MNTMHRTFSIFIRFCCYSCLTLAMLCWYSIPLHAISDENQFSVDLNVTAYVSWDSGAGCTGYNQVYGQQGDYVTLCFAVTNISNVALQNIRIVDASSLPLTTPEPTLLPGATIILWYEGIIGEDLPAEVTVQAENGLQAGRGLPQTFSRPDFTDVAVQQKSPEITLKQTIYLGHDGGTGCNSSSRIEAISGQPLTYCFEITNTGDTFLDDLQLLVPVLSINIDDLVWLNGSTPIAPAGTQLFYYETKAAGNLTTVARVQANPVDDKGNDLIGLHNGAYTSVSATVRTPANSPGIMVLKTGYIGDNEGAHCPGTNLVQAISGDIITYCFDIVNIGTTYLDSVQIFDGQLGLDTPIGNILSPNSRFPLFSSASIDADILNIASVRGNGVDSDGMDLPGLADPTHQDRVLVDIVNPALTLQKSVYSGHDSGDRCPGTAEVTSYYNDFVTYCYIVKNIGDVYLSDIKIEDQSLGVDERNFATKQQYDILAPGEEVVWYYQTRIDGEATLPAMATANPTDKGGIDIPNLFNPSAQSTAQALLEAGSQGFSVRHSLYVGRDNGASCPGLKRLVAPYGTDITYCVVIKNNGSSDLTDLMIRENILEIDLLNMTLKSGSDPLIPGQYLVYYYEGKQESIIESDISVATGDGTTNNDSAFATIANSSLLLETTVYPNLNSGAFCPGNKNAIGATYESFTYCFHVRNQGNTYLDHFKITINDGREIDSSELMTLRGALPLAPGHEIIYYYHAEIEQDIQDSTVVTAWVTDPNGQPLPNVDALVATDEISVERYVSIGDRVWYDANANGLQDRGEEGIAGVLATLHYRDGRSVDQVRTDAEGHFYFDRILPGEYYLKIERPEGHLFTAQNVSTSSDTEKLDSDVDAETGRTSNIIFQSGVGNLDLDAGLLEAASIGNQIWLDENGNGVQDIEEGGISNIVVELYKVNSSTDMSLVDTTVTDGEGRFRFSNLQPGRYVIDVPLSPESGYGFSQKDGGDSDELDSDIDPESGRSPQTLLESGENDDSWDIGLFPAPRLTFSMENNSLDVQPGQSVVYMINYANSGSTTASNVVITKEIPEYTSFDAQTSSEGWRCTEATQCHYELDTIHSQVTEALHFAIKVDPVLPNAADFYEHDLTISYRAEGANPAIPAVTQSLTSQIRFKPPQVIDLRAFSASLTEGLFLFNWTLDSANGLTGFHINMSSDGNRENTQQLTTELLTHGDESQLDYEHQHLVDETAAAGDVHANTFWLVALDEQGNGIEYGPFRLQGAALSGYTFYLPWFSTR